ncbi:hypothetical protein [Brevundimonas diminuta]|uniref:hypothetical protein n=1 Tax=Brevundimonas diminuta TaxID=293 RepID=UPI003207F6AD
MSGVKHTPVRWTAHKTIEAHDGMPECWQIDADHDAVCTTQFCYAPNTEANARLIASAPDLLVALDAIAKASERSETMFGGKMSDVTRVFQNISRVSRTAIARARGEQSQSEKEVGNG